MSDPVNDLGEQLNAGRDLNHTRALRFLVQDIRNIHRFFMDKCEIMGGQEIFQRIGGGMSAGRGESQEGER
jgi:serine/threonine-protein kinase RIO1